MFSYLFSTRMALLVAAAIFSVAIACGSDTATERASADDSVAGAVSDVTEDVDDDHADEEATALAEHEDDEHVVLDDEDHAHGTAAVDPDAPVVHVFATEFAYESTDLEVTAGHPFTIMLHNEGVLEHDITIEGFEEQGGIHLLSKEDGLATFELTEAGKYKVYCTIPGHRAAGMESTLIVEPEAHDDDHDA